MNVSAGREIATRIGHLGVWTKSLEYATASVGREFVRAVESLGFGALWIPESIGSKEVFTHSTLLLSGSDHVVIASGIANIWARDAAAMANGARALADAYPDRFLLGIGVGHAPSVQQRGHSYAHPLDRMREYCDAMDSAPYTGPRAAPPRVLAALGPQMLRLAADRGAGAHPYLVPIEHTRLARRVLGAGPLLAVEQGCVLETDAALARRIARRHLERPLRLANYRNNLWRLGWADVDISEGGSDRLVDALVAWGDESAIRERVDAHLGGGADHVCLQVLTEDLNALPRAQLERIARVLL